jgi:hypothetical protein
MAFFDTALNVGLDVASGGSLLDGAFALITQNRRRIGVLIPHVVIEETHVDDMAVTDHPVETGAAITDHAFLMPQQVEMRCGFSDSKAGFPMYSRLIYEAFLALQRSRKPFTVSTGKRQYKDMLIKSLAVTTDAHSENILNVCVNLRQIILTQTSVSADSGSQADPASTASPTESGQRSVGDASQALPLMAQPGGGVPFGPTSSFVNPGSSSLPTFAQSGQPVFNSINFGG